MLKIIGNDKSNDQLIDILTFNNLLVNKISGYSKQVYYYINKNKVRRASWSGCTSLLLKTAMKEDSNGIHERARLFGF